MADSDPSDQPAAPAKRRNWAAKRSPALSRDHASRQGEITTLAFKLLGGRDEAIAFLNGMDAGLGGRPLDIAMADAEGYQRVAAILLSRAAAS